MQSLANRRQEAAVCLLHVLIDVAPARFSRVNPVGSWAEVEIQAEAKARVLRRLSLYDQLCQIECEFVVLEVSERHVARAEVVELAQRRHVAADLVTALDPDQRRDAARLVDADDVVGSAGQR